MMLITLVWTLVALAGVVISTRALKEAKLDSQTLQDSGLNGPRRIVALAASRREQLRIIIQGLFAASGLIAWLTPPPERLEAPRIFISFLLILAAVLTVANSYLDSQDRQRLMNHFKRKPS